MSHYTCSEFQEYDENEILSSTRSSDEWAPGIMSEGENGVSNAAMAGEAIAPVQAITIEDLV